jgi:selenide,water dikinase
MVRPLLQAAGPGDRVLVGPGTGDDAGVFLHAGEGLIATVDFITPVCDDPFRFGRVAATNSISDVFAMGGDPLFALNVCCFPERVPAAALTAILRGAQEAAHEAGAVILGGHTVQDRELRFGLVVIGRGAPERLLTNSGARPGQRLVLTKPLGTGVLINAFRADRLDAAGLEPALVEMERSNGIASRLALEHGSRAATDITGFGLVGHALGMARASDVELRLWPERLPVHGEFDRLVRGGQSTGATGPNRAHAQGAYEDRLDLSPAESEVLFDPQTSGGLLVAVASENVSSLLGALRDSGHTAAEIGEVVAGAPRVLVTAP